MVSEPIARVSPRTGGAHMLRLWKSSVEISGKWQRAASRRMQAPQSASGWRYDGDDQATSDVIGGAGKHQYLESSRELAY